MILGVGTDIVQVARIARVLARHGERFRARVLVPEERRAFADAAQEARWFAKRYAAKEALAKALGTGIGGQLSFQDIRVANAPGGAPLLALVGAGAALAVRRGIGALHLSLSDEHDYALAFVVVEAARG
jgi:holo-[acyl-carrier protein] synthase